MIGNTPLRYLQGRDVERRTIGCGRSHRESPAIGAEHAIFHIDADPGSRTDARSALLAYHHSWRKHLAAARILYLCLHKPIGAGAYTIGRGPKQCVNRKRVIRVPVVRVFETCSG